jgi:hypothetical protein
MDTDRALVSFTFLAACLLGASACGSAPPSSSGTSSSSGSNSPTPAATECTLPVTQDVYDGFHIGVPSGWSVFSANGTIYVSKDQSATEVSTVTPVLMTSGLTPASVFSSSLESLQRQIDAAGGKMTSRVMGSGGTSPTASLSLQSGSVTMTGEASVVVLPEPTAHGGSVAALLASWAPTSTFANERLTLSAIGNCYGPQQGTLYQVISDKVFTYAIPLGWSVASEGQDLIEIADGNNASATYSLSLFLPGSGVDSPQAVITFDFGKLGITIDQIIGSHQSQQVVNGTTEGLLSEEFTGTLSSGQAVHGEVHVVADTASSTPSGVIRLALTTPALWNSTNGALAHILNSIQHSFAQDFQQWEHVTQQQQAFAQQVQGFDYALTGVDLVNDPATGATFEAPYDRYNQTGPDGPGYYDQANNKLTIETP